VPLEIYLLHIAIFQDFLSSSLRYMAIYSYTVRLLHALSSAETMAGQLLTVQIINRTKILIRKYNESVLFYRFVYLNSKIRSSPAHSALVYGTFTSFTPLG